MKAITGIETVMEIATITVIIMNTTMGIMMMIIAMAAGNNL
jgi:hypothetical protein